MLPAVVYVLVSGFPAHRQQSNEREEDKRIIRITYCAAQDLATKSLTVEGGSEWGKAIVGAE